MTTATMPDTGESKSSISKRLSALARAEWLQLRRNTVLISMLPMPTLATMFFAWIGDGTHAAMGLVSDAYILFALGFFVYYSSLSMATTRRDEKVLKRLRTGEARDGEILTSIVLPLSVLTFIIAAITLPIIDRITTDDVALTHNVALMAVVLMLGIALSHGLALLTSIFTRNAEAAMITSSPVLILVVIAQSAIRMLVPEWLENILQWNPFALIVDLYREGWAGDATDMIWARLGVLVLWTVLCVWAGYRFMRWDTHR